jgi:hypothetical protein
VNGMYCETGCRLFEGLDGERMGVDQCEEQPLEVNWHGGQWGGKHSCRAEVSGQ